MLISNQTATNLPLSNKLPINSDATQASMNGRNVISTDSVLQKGAQHLSSALQNMPNPLYYITKMPGQILPAVLLMSRAIGSDAKPIPAGSDLTEFVAECNNSSLPTTGSAGPTPAATDSAKAQMLEEIARDDGEAAHRQLVSSLKSSNSSAFAFDMANADAAGSKTRPTGTGWEPVPVPDDFNQALNQNETTTSGEFARTPGKGTGKQLNAVQERLTFPRHSEPTTSFRFHLGGVTHNNVNGLPTPKGCISSSDNSKATVNSHSNSRQPVWCPEAPPPPSAELTTCFHTEDSLGRSNLVNTRAKIANGLFLDSCPKAVPAGETISGSMDIHIKKPGPATIFQIHSTPDRLLYRDNIDAIHTLSQQASKETYEHLIDDRMQFEQEGKPPFSIAIAQKDNLPYLTITGRSDFARFADTECDLPSFRGGRSEELAFRMVRCCDDKSSAAYLYHMPLSNFHDPNYQPDFANVKYEINFSNYSGPAATKGQVKVWIDDRNVVNASIYIGANNRPERGGGQYFATFGISDMSSRTPVTVKFRNVEFNQGKLTDRPAHEQKDQYNLGECTGRIDQQCP